LDTSRIRNVTQGIAECLWKFLWKVKKI
jgi:hypothetical protein